MAVTAWAGQGAATFAFASTQHESSITGFREILGTTGGQQIEVADGTVLQTVTKTTVVAIEVDCVPSLAAADLWRYLRETASTTGTITIGLTSSTTESATNPEHVYTVSGWSRPGLDYSAGQTRPMTAIFTVTGNPTVDVTWPVAGELTLDGAEQVKAWFGDLAASAQTEVDQAMMEHGRVVGAAASALAPGSLKQSLTATYTPTGLQVAVNTATYPHGYTMHATALGTANGYMVFRVPQHSRRGSTVSAYKRRAPIPNRPYLYQAWTKLLPDLYSKVSDAIGTVLRG